MSPEMPDALGRLVFPGPLLHETASAIQVHSKHIFPMKFIRITDCKKEAGLFDNIMKF